MDKRERLQAHDIQLPPWYMPNPEAHLCSPRDSFHFSWVKDALHDMPGCSILDVGCWDFWLGFLLRKEGFFAHGVEVIPDLVRASVQYAIMNDVKDHHVYQGFFDDVEIPEKYDVVMCLETLEHIPLDDVMDYVGKMESIAKCRILISLPDQKHEENAQHLWTPCQEIIQEFFRFKKNVQMIYRSYGIPGLPNNFLIRYDI